MCVYIFERNVQLQCLSWFFFSLYKLFHSSLEQHKCCGFAANLQHSTQEGQYNLYNYCAVVEHQVYKCNKDAYITDLRECKLKIS